MWPTAPVVTNAVGDGGGGQKGCCCLVTEGAIGVGEAQNISPQGLGRGRQNYAGGSSNTASSRCRLGLWLFVLHSPECLGITRNTIMALNSQRTSYFSLLSAWIKGVHHLAWLSMIILTLSVDQFGCEGGR